MDDQCNPLDVTFTTEIEIEVKKIPTVKARSRS